MRRGEEKRREDGEIPSTRVSPGLEWAGQNVWLRPPILFRASKRKRRKEEVGKGGREWGKEREMKRRSM